MAGDQMLDIYAVWSIVALITAASTSHVRHVDRRGVD